MVRHLGKSVGIRACRHDTYALMHQSTSEPAQGKLARARALLQNIHSPQRIVRNSRAAAGPPVWSCLISNYRREQSRLKHVEDLMATRVDNDRDIVSDRLFLAPYED